MVRNVADRRGGGKQKPGSYHGADIRAYFSSAVRVYSWSFLRDDVLQPVDRLARDSIQRPLPAALDMSVDIGRSDDGGDLATTGEALSVTGGRQTSGTGATEAAFSRPSVVRATGSTASTSA